jgi:putative transposase
MTVFALLVDGRLGSALAPPIGPLHLMSVSASGLRRPNRSGRASSKGWSSAVSDVHNGWRHAITRVLGSSWQRCRVHWIRNALARLEGPAHPGRRRDPPSFPATLCHKRRTRPGATSPTRCRTLAQTRCRTLAQTRCPDGRERADVLAYMAVPAQHRTKLHSTNPLERLNKEVKGRADVVGIFPNEASITRLLGAVPLEQNDEWLLQCRYMQI